MKPYRTSFLSIAAFMMLLYSMTFIHTQSAQAADCGFTLSSNDLTWSFTANAGASQSRSLVITNTSGASLTLKIGISGTDAFSVNHSDLTLAAGDTATITITFHPGLTATGTITGTLTVAKANSDCHQSLGLSGTVNVTQHGDVIVADPHEYNFGTLALGSDSCKYFTVTNTTKSTVIITSWTRCDNADFNISASFDGKDTLAAGATANFKVCYTPNSAHLQSSCSITVHYLDLDPLSDGQIVINLSGSVHANNGGDAIIVADPHEYGFGTVEFGTSACKDFVVTNKSKNAVILRNWSKCDNTDFTVTPGFTVADTLAAGASMTFTVCYKPHEAGISGTCSLVISYLQPDPLSDGSITISMGGNSGTDTTHHNTICLKTEQGQNYHDAIVVGGTADHTLYLINSGATAITVNSATISGTDAGVFSISSTLPIVVPANSSNTTLTYTFAPTTNTKIEFTAAVTLGLSGDNLSCKSVDGHLIGYIVHNSNNVDTVVRPLFPTEKRTLAVEGSANKAASVNFYFTNNLQVDCTVNKIYMADGTYFTISSTNPTPTPFVLHPGANLTVVVTYTATDNLVHHDQLMVDANHNLQAQAFDMQGLNLAASVPNALPMGVAINVSPNPASSYVKVDMAGINAANIQVIDLLGNIISTAKANTSWKWDATNFVSGSYIVRIAGTSTTGEQFVASKRIIVSK